MEFIKIRLSNDFEPMGSKLEKTISEMFRSMNPMFAFSKNSWKPQLDMFETPEKIIVIAELAGVEKDALELEINSRAIRISGRRLLNPPAENGRYRLAEIQYGTFDRALYLPAPIDTEKAEAAFKWGLLHIHLPKVKFETRFNIPITGE
ncbi:MAG: Hsp20/alpha crystallin family protein [Desulfobacterales bacterium]|jgi:HSP20 family protein|nr:Hsp20/alpha crystallin family protein [Desulfobacterales bacterium]